MPVVGADDRVDFGKVFNALKGLSASGPGAGLALIGRRSERPSSPPMAKWFVP